MKTDEIKTTAQLAMLEISNPEDFTQAFSEMLDYFESMMAVDVSELEPTTHALVRENRLRPDVTRDSDVDARLLDNAPERKDDFFKIPNVL